MSCWCFYQAVGVGAVNHGARGEDEVTQRTSWVTLGDKQPLALTPAVNLHKWKILTSLQKNKAVERERVERVEKF